LNPAEAARILYKAVLEIERCNKVISLLDRRLSHLEHVKATAQSRLNELKILKERYAKHGKTREVVRIEREQAKLEKTLANIESSLSKAHRKRADHERNLIHWRARAREALAVIERIL